MRAALAFLACLAVFLCGEVTWADESFEPGREHTALDGQLGISGYLALELHVTDQKEHQLLLEGLALFLTYNPRPAVRVFGEFELVDVVRLEDDGFHAGRRIFTLERLSLEYEPSPAFRLRVGQLLTPVGIWNTIHAAPLVWTTSRPLATKYFFDTAMTGLQVDSPMRVGAFDVVATVFGQATDHLDETEDMQQAERAFGGRLQFGGQQRWHVATSYLRFEDEREKRWESTIGADFIFENDDWELTSEFAVNDPDGIGRTTWGAYGQAVHHAGHGFHPFVRYEHVKLEGTSGSPVVFGIGYKPGPSSIIKMEGVVGARDLGSGGNGFISSYAILF